MACNQRFNHPAQAPYNAVPLPPGRQMACSLQGEIYYIDHNTRSTHWEIPPEALQMANAPSYRVGRARRGIDRTKMKTKMCMNIQNGGKCTWGDSCAFAHSSEELAAVPHGNNGHRGRVDMNMPHGVGGGVDVSAHKQ